MVNEPPPLLAGIGVAQKPEVEVGLKRDRFPTVKRGRSRKFATVLSRWMPRMSPLWTAPRSTERRDVVDRIGPHTRVTEVDFGPGPFLGGYVPASDEAAAITDIHFFFMRDELLPNCRI